MLDYISDIEHVPSRIKLYYALATLLMYIVFFVVIQKRSNKGETVKTVLMLGFMTVFSLFYCINSDYFNYRMVVNNPIKYFTEGTIEVTTFAIASFVDGNYELFRLIIWGSAILFYFLASKFLKLNSYVSLLLWFVFFNGIIFYARATLAMAIFFLGAAIIIRGKKNIFSFLLGLAIMVVSIFFHREMMVAVGLSPVMFIKISKKNYKKILLAVLILVIPATFIIINNPSLLNDITNNDTYADRFNSYQDEMAEGTWGGQNIFGYMIIIIRYIIYYFMIFTIAKVFLRKQDEQDEHFVMMRKMFQLASAIIVVASLFFIIFGFGVFFYRIIFISAIPLSLVLSYLYTNRLISKQTMTTLVLYSLFVYFVNLIGI